MPDKDEVPGSSPGRPTSHRRRSERCRQQAGSARWLPGPRWGRTPIPAGKPIGPSGPVHAGGRHLDNHAQWSPTHPGNGSLAAGAASSRALAQPPATGAPHARLAYPGGSVKHGRRHTRPGPGPPPTAPPTMGDLGGVAGVRAFSAVGPSRSRTRQPTGTWARSRGAGCLAASASPQCHRLMGTRRTRPDGRTPDGWTPDGRTPDPGRRAQVTGHRADWTPGGLDTGRTGHWTGRTAGPRTTEPDGWTPMLDADRRPTPWLAFWHVEHGDGACPLDGRWTLGWAAASGRSTNQDSSAATTTRGITLLRTGLDHRHDRQLLGRFAGQAAPRRTAVLKRESLGVRRRVGG